MKRLLALVGVDSVQTPSSFLVLVMLFVRARDCMYVPDELTRKRRTWFYQSVASEVKNTILSSLQPSNIPIRIGYKSFVVNGYWYLLYAYFYTMMNLEWLLPKRRRVEWSVFCLTTGNND